ncbi:MAG: hypothetical protein ACYDAO_04365 [Thermoplasmataceae archaeon]
MINDKLREKIIELHNAGKSYRQISMETSVSRPSIKAILEKIETPNSTPLNSSAEPQAEKIINIPDIDEMIDSLKNPRKTQPETKKGDSGKKEIGGRVLDNTELNYIKKAGTELSKTLMEELRESLDLALQVRRFSLIYRADIEAMDIGWLDFISWAIPHAFNEVKDAWVARMEEEHEDNELKELINEAVKGKIAMKMIDLGTGKEELEEELEEEIEGLDE